MFRVRSPPILHDPIVDEDEDETDLGWYYGENAGGYHLTFGRHYGEKIHAISLSYLYWCDREFKNRNHPVIKAFAKFLDGLEEYATTNYGDFRVPFGRKHQGKRISECRDKRWLLWTSTKDVLTEKYPVFFTAVEHWLENPHHQGIKRDIGELLHASEYEDDLNLNGGFEYDDEEPTQSDLDFIDDSGLQDAENRSDDMSESTGVAQDRQADTEEAVVAEASATEDDSEDDSEPASWYNTPPPPPPRKTWDKARGTARPADDSFIVKDDEDDGSDDYEDLDSELAVSTPMRVTRSSAKKEALKNAKAVSASSPSVSGARHRTHVRVSSGTLSSSSDSGSIARSAPRRARRNLIRSTFEGDAESDQSDRLPFDPHTPSSRPRLPPTTCSPGVRSTRRSKQRVRAPSIDDVPSLTRASWKRARRNIVDSSSDADDPSDTHDAPTYNISHLPAPKAGSKARERAGSPDPFLRSPIFSGSSLLKRRLKTRSHDTPPSSDVDSDESGPVVENPQQVSKQLRGRSCSKRGRSSDEPEPATVTRGRRAANTATPTRKKPRVVDYSLDRFPSARPSRGEVKLPGPPARPYVLLPHRATSAADRSPVPSPSAPLPGNKLGTPRPRPRPYVLLPRCRVSDIE